MRSPARWIRILLIALAALLLAAPAPAQIGAPGGPPQRTQQPQPTTGRARPPSPPEAETPPIWIYYLVFAALIGATVFVSLLPSKRGHQD